MVNRFAIKSGFALLELTFVTLIIGILLTMMMSNGMGLIKRAKFQATVREMESIAQAAIDYYNSSHNPNDPLSPQPLAWPSSDASKLGGPYVTQAVAVSPFGGGYQLFFANNMVTVSTVIPGAIAIDPAEGSFLSITPVSGGQQISITQSIPNEYTGRLTYDLQYLYKK